MRSAPELPASLVNLGGPDLPPVVLSVSAQYQFCVDAGAASAVCFFDDLTAMGLHDHIAASMHGFMQTLRALQAATGGTAPIAAQSCTDAFAAGYLGRIQQELRLFRNEGSGHAARRPYVVH